MWSFVCLSVCESLCGFIFSISFRTLSVRGPTVVHSLDENCLTESGMTECGITETSLTVMKMF